MYTSLSVPCTLHQETKTNKQTAKSHFCFCQLGPVLKAPRDEEMETHPNAENLIQKVCLMKMQKSESTNLMKTRTVSWFNSWVFRLWEPFGNIWLCFRQNAMICPCNIRSFPLGSPTFLNIIIMIIIIEPIIQVWTYTNKKEEEGTRPETRPQNNSVIYWAPQSIGIALFVTLCFRFLFYYYGPRILPREKPLSWLAIWLVSLASTQQQQQQKWWLNHCP